MQDQIKKGEHIITPLFMHELCVRYPIEGDYMFWEKFCLNLLKRCDIMYVLMLDGWKESRGVSEEIKFCEANDIPVRYVGYTPHTECSISPISSRACEIGTRGCTAEHLKLGKYQILRNVK